jgi:hypothetical protein
MKYLKSELVKIRKSRSLFIILLLALSYSIFVYAEYFYEQSTNQSFFIFFYKSISGLTDIPIFNIGSIVFTSLLFAKEFEDRTILYIFMRPVECSKLFFSKIIAIIIYSFGIIIILFLNTLIVSICFFGIKVLPGDISIANSIIRCLVCLLYTFVGILISTGLSCLMAVTIKNEFGSIILSTIIFMITTIWTLKIGKYTIPISTYQNPVNYFTINFNEFLVRCRNFTMLNIVVIFVLMALSYHVLRQLRKGLKNY